MTELDETAMDLAHTVINAVSPDEIEDFNAIAEYQTNPHSSHHHGVGINIDVIAGSLIGMLLPILQESVRELAKRLSQLAVDELARNVSYWITRLRAPPQSLQTASVPNDQLLNAIETVVDAARGRGLSVEASAALRATLIARLVRNSG